MKRLLKPTNFKRILFFVLTDIVASIFTLYLAYLLRFNFNIPQQFLTNFWQILFLVAIAKILVFNFLKIYTIVWRFFSLSDAKKLIIGHIIAYTLIAVIYFLNPNLFNPFPRSVLLIDLFLSIVTIGGVRFSKRLILEQNGNKTTPVIIIGLTNNTPAIIKSFLDNDTSYYPVAIFDKDRVGNRVMNVGIYSLDDLEKIINNNSVKTAIIAKNLSKGELKKYIDKLNNLGVYSIKRAQLLQDETKLRDITVEDFLSREPKDLDQKVIKEFIENKKVLVTGGGGSIGSEIVRQCKKFGAKEIIVIEHSEFNLYQILEEVKELKPYLISVTKRDKIFEIMEKESPDIVVHAAAYKHVPICEANIEAAIENNIIGTINVVDASIKAEVKKLVIISTDKAVRPTNVMGATKRVTELYEGNVDSKNTEIVAVRFGNVLGSSGSVIPKFKKQIESGGPVTVTHPDMTRYFMLIPEACQLVLQAAAIAKGGELFILDMGEPVKIADLAKSMIKLLGKEGEVEIVYTGLRPGEKLYEELLIDESEQKTKYSSIYVAKKTKYPIDKLKNDIEGLVKSCNKLKKLQEIVPEYQPKRELNE